MWCVDPCKQLSIYTATCLFLSVDKGEHRRSKSEEKKQSEKSFQAIIALEDSPHPVIHLPRFILMSIVLYDAKYCIGQFGSVVLLVSSPNILCTLSLLTGDLDGKKETLRLCCSAIPKTFLCYQLF